MRLYGIFSPSVTYGDTSLVRGRQEGQARGGAELCGGTKAPPYGSPRDCSIRTFGDAGPYNFIPRSGISHLPQANSSHCVSNISHRRQAVYRSSPKAMSMNTPLRHASRATSPQGARQGSVAVRLVVRILRGVRTIFLGPLTEGAVERMRDWGSLTFNTPSVGYADTSLTREARVLCGIRRFR